MRSLLVRSAFAVVLGASLVASAQAQFISSFSSLSSPNTMIVDFGQHNTIVPDGYSALLPGSSNILMSYSDPNNEGLYFDFCGWGLLGNGSSCINSVGVNQSGLLRFDFLGGPVSGVGVFMNYAPNFGNDVSITALDAGNNVLGQVDVEAFAPITGSTFQFRGFQDATADIAFSFSEFRRSLADPLEPLVHNDRVVRGSGTGHAPLDGDRPGRHDGLCAPPPPGLTTKKGRTRDAAPRSWRRVSHIRLLLH